MNLKFLTNNEEIINSVKDFVTEFTDSNKHIRVQTSGSTGPPKMVSLKKKQLIASAKMTIQFLGLTEQSIALLCLSPTTIAGKMMIVRAILAKMELIVVEPTSTPLRAQIHVDFVAMVPMQVEAQLRIDRNILFAVKKLIIGGAPISDSLRNELIDHPGEVYHTFGMTETISHIALRRLNTTEHLPYTALDGIFFSQENKQLIIRAPHLDIDHLPTNDIVELVSDSSFYWLGRKDFVINSGGYKIHPEQIEKVLSSVIVNTFFSIGIEDRILGQKHILCIEGDLGTELTKAFFHQELNSYSIPKEIYYYSKFIYTLSGKIDKLETQKLKPNVIRQVL